MPNARRLITVDQILEIAKADPRVEDVINSDRIGNLLYFSHFAEERSLPGGYVLASESRLWDMDARAWIDDAKAAQDIREEERTRQSAMEMDAAIADLHRAVRERPPAPSASWREVSPVRSLYVREDGAVLGEVEERCEGEWEIWLGGVACDTAKARPNYFRVWTSDSGARAELARVCRVLGWAA